MVYQGDTTTQYQFRGSEIEKRSSKRRSLAASRDLRSESGTITTDYDIDLEQLSVSTNGYGWMCHAGGVGKLIETLGPEAHQSGLGMRYFMLSRLSIVRYFLLLT